MQARIFLAVLVLALSACGGAESGSTGDDEAAIDVTTSGTPEPVTTQSPQTTATTLPAPTTTAAEVEDAGDADSGAADDGGEPGVLAGDVVEIIMDDFTFEPSEITVTAGQTVRFRVVNVGAVAHEFRLSNPHRVAEHLASGHDDHDDDGGDGHHEGGDVFIELEPGMTGELEVTFPEDTTIYTEIACLLPGHYEAGMLGTVAYD